MVGNSVRSDVLPVLEIGARAVHVPYHLTWALEEDDSDDVVVAEFQTLSDIAELPKLISSLDL